MSVELIIGERQKGEGATAVVACNDYLRMGIGRSISKLLSIYYDEDKYSPKNASNGLPEPPTRNRSTLTKWSSKYSWVARAEEYDNLQENLKTEEANRIMNEGLALAHERVKKLIAITKELENEYLKDTSNTKLANTWMHAIDDIAKEVGGRTAKSAIDLNANVNQEVEIKQKLVEDMLNKIYGDDNIKDE